MEIFPPTDWTKHPLHVAAMSGNMGEVERLLSQGADVNENVFQEGAPLHVAVRHCPGGFLAAGQGHVAVIRLLLNRGADVHAGRGFSGTPLHEVAYKGDTDLAEILLGYGADINSKQEDHHRTPLHRAVAAGKEHMVEFLLSRGADVNAVADFNLLATSARSFPDCGMTPLHVAAREGYLEIACRLLAAGAAKDIQVTKTDLVNRRFQGLTAFDLALLHTRKLEERLMDSVKLSELLDGANRSRA
jgi:ankyrin repeat protein